MARLHGLCSGNLVKSEGAALRGGDGHREPDPRLPGQVNLAALGCVSQSRDSKDAVAVRHKG